MGTYLIYHGDEDEFSPFDRRAIEIAKAAQLRIACPYLSLDYLSNRLIEVALSWRLVTDIKEWLTATIIAERQTIIEFIIANSDNIRNHQGLHAKVLIGNGLTMIGSANFTKRGMTSRTEMGVFTDNVNVVREVSIWFDKLWSTSARIESMQLRNMIKGLPKPPNDTSPQSLKASGQIRNAALIPLKQEPELLYFWGAVGYRTDTGAFCVRKGSPARSYVRDSYKYTSLRNKLIREGVLSPDNGGSNYKFTVDYHFSTRSAAACIVSGQMRSGPDVWKKITS